MLYRIKTKDQTVELSAVQIIDTLIGKTIQESRTDLETLGNLTTELLQAKEALSTMSAKQIMSLGLAIGFYYSRFLRLNDVTVVEESDASENSSNSSAE